MKAVTVLAASIGVIGAAYTLSKGGLQAPPIKAAKVRSSPAPAAPDPTPTPANRVVFTAGLDPDADAVLNEQSRPKSTALAAYEKKLDALEHRAAIAEMLWRCGLRGGGWYGDTRDVYASDWDDMMPLRLALTSAELNQSVTYQKLIRKTTVSFYMGQNDITEKGCKAMAAMPLATDDTFLYSQ